MGKKVSFKANFSRLLETKYNMTKKGIEGYWKNKEKEESFNRKADIALAVGIGEAVGTVGFTLWDMSNGIDCVIPISIFAGISVLTAATAALKRNPYEKEEYEEQDEDYNDFKSRVKKVNKSSKRK